MPTPTDDEMLDAIAEDVATGVRSSTTGDQITTLETPTERIETVEKFRKVKATRPGINAMPSDGFTWRYTLLLFSSNGMGGPGVETAVFEESAVVAGCVSRRLNPGASVGRVAV